MNGFATFYYSGGADSAGVRPACKADMAARHGLTVKARGYPGIYYLVHQQKRPFALM
ncbi:MAG: hypothetical protein HC843_05810 [Sphingomonadales bacterium]|nr:hypothetical protein [Sphingomonadales bacterium]